MTTLRSSGPNVTHVVPDASDFTPDAGATYLYARSHEPRSRVFQTSGNFAQAKPIEVVAYTRWSFDVLLGSSAETVGLRDAQQVRAFVRRLDSPVFLDITGLPHHVWAPLLRGLSTSLSDVRVTYVEPADYLFSGAPTEGAIFDLSEEIGGIAPLPGFARLADPEPGEPVWFVALLGFEGTRFAHMLEQLQPPAERIIPVIGVPGFRPEYPFYAYQGNRAPLVATGAWRRMEYCTANSPFDLALRLEKISEDGPSYLQIAVVGTKPHSLGAVLFAIRHPDRCELVYDFPVRSPKRTVGAARQLVYYVSEYLGGNS